LVSYRISHTGGRDGGYRLGRLCGNDCGRWKNCLSTKWRTVINGLSRCISNEGMAGQPEIKIIATP
jgi:hypothetical protein